MDDDVFDFVFVFFILCSPRAFDENISVPYSHRTLHHSVQLCDRL